MDTQPIFSDPGYCHCCRRQTVFHAYRAWLRDHYRCENCGSIPRQRHIQFVLDLRFPGWETKTIHESSPTEPFIAQYAQGFSCSAFFPNVEPGGSLNGIRYENLEALTFPDQSFDLFITQDVLEHVFDPRRAIREVHRVLKPGGAHIFTTPKHRALLTSRCRARRELAGDIEYLAEAEYHGSPQGDGRALVTWDFGGDFEELLSGWAGVPVETIYTVDRSRGIDAAFNEVFVIRRSMD